MAGLLKDLVSIGFDKQLQADFSISYQVQELSYEEMNALRAMAVVALAQREDIWARRPQGPDQAQCAQDPVEMRAMEDATR